MSTIDYKTKFGVDSLSTKEYREQKALHFSRSNTGKPTWNKGQKTGPNENLTKALQTRELKYQSGELVRRQYAPLDEVIKQKISQSIKKYADANHEELSDRFYKAQKTKLALGVPLMPSFKGGKHTDKNKKAFADRLSIYRGYRIKESHSDILQKINSVELVLLNDVNDTSLQLSCKKCNTIFTFTKQYFHDCKFHDRLCPTCHPRNILTSKAQVELYDIIKLYHPTAVLNYKTEYGDIDIYIESMKLGIEYNGLYWHSTEVLTYNNKSKIKDFQKYEKLKSDGIKIVCIFEDEWLSKRTLVLSRLENIFKQSKTVFARKCTIRQIETDEAKEFIDCNHIQGYGNAQIKYGLFLDTVMLSVMTFSKSNISRKNSEWEISRFCNKIGFSVVGGASKLFKHFVEDHNPEQVISYADSRWSDGNLYKQLGFVFSRQTVPNYWYFKPNELRRIHRFTLRKRADEPKESTEKELRFTEGYYHIYDYGSSKWIWTK